MDPIAIALLFFLVALIYSSAGFGGGSSYLAIMALLNWESAILKPTALLCNITVVLTSVFIFSSHKLFPWRKIGPLVLFSIPFAFLGGSLRLEERIFFILLGTTLLISSIAMLLQNKKEAVQFFKGSNAVIGGSVGFLSGLVGIGGGIFLSPFLHLTRWANAKNIAAATAVFILVNSIAGLIGHYSTHAVNLDFNKMWPLLLAVFIGAQLGPRANLKWFTPRILKQVTAVLIFFVAIRILNEYL